MTDRTKIADALLEGGEFNSDLLNVRVLEDGTVFETQDDGRPTWESGTTWRWSSVKAYLLDSDSDEVADRLNP